METDNERSLIHLRRNCVLVTTNRNILGLQKQSINTNFYDPGSFLYI